MDNKENASLSVFWTFADSWKARYLTAFKIKGDCLPWLLFAFFVACFLFYPDGPFILFRARDTDDYMRLVQVRALLNGQSWYDFSVPRLGPDTVLSWSRLVDAPLFLMAKGLSLFMPQEAALRAAALVVPLFLCALLIPLARMMARPFVSRTKVFWAPLILFSCSSPFLFQFTPTRVDHHAYYLLFSGLAFASLVRMIYAPRAFWPPLVGAASCALGLWIGAEIFPFLILFGAALGILSTLRGGRTMRTAALFGLFFGLFAVLLLGIARPVSSWFGHELLWFSGAYVIFALLMGAVFVFQNQLARPLPWPWLRMVTLIGLSGLMAVFFFVLIPEATQGPYANFEPESAKMILGHVSESRSFLDVLTEKKMTSLPLLLLMGPFVMPLAAMATVAFSRAPRRYRLLLLAFTFAACFLIGSLVWQRRVFPYVQLFAVPLLAWSLTRVPARYGARVSVFLLLTFIPSVLLPWAGQAKAFYPDLALFYAARKEKFCDVTRAAHFLGDSDGYGASPQRIANMMSSGPALLYFTPHSVLAAPYNVTTNGEALKFFSDRQGEISFKIAQERNIDLVLLCRKIPRIYVGKETPVWVRSQKGRLVLQSSAAMPTLAEKLVREEPPDWLKKVDSFEDKAFVLYERTR